MRRISRESWFLVSICVADLLTTLWFVCVAGGAEANPIMRFYLGLGVVPFIMAKALLVAGPLVVVEWARRQHPRFAQNMLRVGITLYLVSYGTVVWKINAVGQTKQDTFPLEHASEAQLASIERWAATPANEIEMSAIRATMR